MRKIKRKFIFNDETDDDDDDVEGREEEEEESAKKTSNGLTAYIAYVKKIVGLYVEYLDPSVDLEAVETSAGDIAGHAIKVARKIYKVCKLNLMK